MLINSQPQKATRKLLSRLSPQYLYLAGDTSGGDQAVAQAKQPPGRERRRPSTSRCSSIQQLGQQLQAAIKQLTKQQQQTQGATARRARAAARPPAAAAPGGNPLRQAWAPAGSSCSRPFL